MILVDSYYYSNDYIKALNQVCATAAVGDRSNADCPADIIINYNIYADKCVIRSGKKKTAYYIGTKYFPLRDEFIGKQKNSWEGAAKIYLTAGSTDPAGLLPLLVELLAGEGYEIKASAGRFHKQISCLRKMEERYENFKLYVNPSHVSDIMAGCDMAVSAAGITLYELCYLGIPAVTYAFADNQLLGARAFEEEKVMLSVNDIRGCVKEKAVQIADKVRILAGDETIRKTMAKHMRQYVDGKGARRTAHILNTYWQEGRLES